LISSAENLLESVGVDSGTIDKIKSVVGIGQDGDSFSTQQTSTDSSSTGRTSSFSEFVNDVLKMLTSDESKSGYADSTDWSQQYSGAVSTLQSNFDLLDTAAGVGGKDGLIGRDDLKAALENPNLPKEIKDACRFLLDNPSAWNKLDVGAGQGGVDGLISRGDLEAEAARIAASQAAVGGGANGSAEGSEEVDYPVPERFQSYEEGGYADESSSTSSEQTEEINLDGLSSDEAAQVLIDEKLSSLEEQIQAKLAEMENTKDPSKLARENYVLQNLLEMRKQMFTLMSNLSAVYNEMAKTAISNLGRA
jgi:hypothetical protein